MEYIHSKDYVHADIKGANILLGATKETANQVYLVDFGLATRFSTATEFKPDPKKAHDGTIEYLSRDAHKGGNCLFFIFNIFNTIHLQSPFVQYKVTIKYAN